MFAFVTVNGEKVEPTTRNEESLSAAEQARRWGSTRIRARALSVRPTRLNVQCLKATSPLAPGCCRAPWSVGESCPPAALTSFPAAAAAGGLFSEPGEGRGAAEAEAWGGDLAAEPGPATANDDDDDDDDASGREGVEAPAARRAPSRRAPGLA